MKAMVKRAIRGITGRKPRVAATYAAMHGSAKGMSFMVTMAAKVFGVDVARFTVPGEHGHASDAASKKIIDEADVIFVAGGDPVAGAELLLSSGADAWLRDARQRGQSLLGVSAGSMMLAAWWAKWPDDPPPGAPFDGAELVECARVVGDLVVDCHAEEDDWVELRTVDKLLTARGGAKPRLLGLPNGGGVIVDGEGNLEEVGVAPFVLR